MIVTDRVVCRVLIVYSVAQYMVWPGVLHVIVVFGFVTIVEELYDAPVSAAAWTTVNCMCTCSVARHVYFS